jgi:hypothetical protein
MAISNRQPVATIIHSDHGTRIGWCQRGSPYDWRYKHGRGRVSPSRTDLG